MGGDHVWFHNLATAAGVKKYGCHVDKIGDGPPDIFNVGFLDNRNVSGAAHVPPCAAMCHLFFEKNKSDILFNPSEKNKFLYSCQICLT